MNVLTINPIVNKTLLLESLINSFGSGKDAYKAAVHQLVMNGLDAGATRIDLVYINTPKKVQFYIKDNGRGMRQAEDLSALYGMFNSQKSLTGNTHGKMGSGRISCLLIAKEIQYLSCSEETGKGNVWVAPMNRDIAVEILSGNLQSRHKIVPKSSLPLAKELPGFGTIVELTGLDQELLPTSAVSMVNALRMALIPSDREKVFVNGDSITEFLPEGTYERVFFKEEHPVLGSIEVDIFATERQRNNRIIVAGKSRIFDSIARFLENYFSEEKQTFLSDCCFFDPTLVGTVAISKLNRYRDHSSDNKLENAFIGSKEHDAAAEWLERTLDPKIKQALNKMESVHISKTGEQLVRALVEAFGTTEKKEHTPKTRKQKTAPAIAVSPRHVVVSAGDQVELTIADRGNFQWSCSDLSGSLKRLDVSGRNMLFTAGETPGHYRITVQKKRTGEDTTVNVHVLPKEHLCISPSESSIVAGGKARFQVLNPQVTGGKELIWEITGKPKGLRLTQETGGVTCVEAASGILQGQYTITVSTKDGNKTAEAALTVRPPDVPTNLIRIGGKSYEIKERASQSDALAVVQKRLTGHPIMLILTEHPLLSHQRRNKREKLLLLIPSMVDEHIRYVGEGDAEELRLALYQHLL